MGGSLARGGCQHRHRPTDSKLAAKDLLHAVVERLAEQPGRVVRIRPAGHQQLRAVNQGLGELDHLLHTGGEGPELAVSRFAETDVEEGFVRALEGRLGGQPAELGHQAYEVDCGHVGDERIVFGHVADLGAKLLALVGQ